MVKRDEIIEYINKILGKDLLAKSARIDPNANGVQIHGASDVDKVALGVSMSHDLLSEAVQAGAQFVITHHGLRLSAKYIYNSKLDKSQQKELKYVFANDLTIAGYHYALDAHTEIGNSAVIIQELGAKRLDIPYFSGWGWVAEFSQAIDPQEIARRLADITSHDVFAVYTGKEKIKRIGVCTGGARPSAPEINEISDLGIEVHITGEISESGPAIAKEAGYTYPAAGHYATEVFGVQELGKKLKSHFGNKLEVEFIDIPNSL